VTGTKGYPELWIKPEYHKNLAIIQRVIAYAGRYSYYQAYHLRILAHFEDNQTINFPYFFYKSLEKMASQTQKNIVNPKASLCHHGLVKILVMDELSKQGREWRDFVQEVTLSLEHPPMEDVPPTIDDEIPPADAATHATTPSQANTSSPVHTPIVNDRAKDSPFTNPPADNVDLAPTPT